MTHNPLYFPADGCLDDYWHHFVDPWRSRPATVDDLAANRDRKGPKWMRRFVKAMKGAKG